MTLLLACGDDSGDSCEEPGETEACECESGASGQALCQDDGTLAACSCERTGRDGGNGDDSDAGDNGTDGGTGGGSTGITEAFWGERSCEYTTATFAGEWSPADTSTETIIVEEVEGGFSVGGVDRETPFSSCPVFFDYDGESASLRQPQPCRDGVASYDSGVIVVDGDTFSFDILGRAFGYPVSMKVDCGAGEVSIGEPEPNSEDGGWLGEWQCSGVLSAPDNPTTIPVTMVHTIESLAEGRLRSSFEPTPDSPPFVSVFNSCNIFWDIQSETVATIGDDAQCASGPGSWARSATGMELADDMLIGSVDMELDGTINQSLSFNCER